MFRASVILKNAREDRSLELEEISKKLKISLRYLRAIEAEDRPNFPQEPYCSLIIKDYAAFLGLNGEEILSLFRRDFANLTKTKTQSDAKIFITPQFTFKIAVIASIVIFAAYLVLEYAKFNHPPNLKVNWPTQNTLSQSSFDITGTTDADSTIRINNELVIVDQNGNFEKKVSLNATDTLVTVESKSPSGKTTRSEMTLHLSDNTQTK